METLSDRIAAKRLRYARANAPPRPRHIRDLADWATDCGASHTINLVPDIYVSTRFDPDKDFKPILRRLAKAIAHDVRSVPHRQMGTEGSLNQTVWMVGVVETATKTGMVYPHFHGVVALRPHEDRLLKGVLAHRWGKGRGAPALRPVFKRPGSFPDFDVKRLTDPGGWFSYDMKNTTLDHFVFWSHRELLGRDA
jgi:hypothetical protein